MPNTRLRVGFEDICPTVVAEVGVCHKSPLLAIFFPSFHSSSCLLKVTLQENTKKHHILQDSSLVLITTRRGSYLINTLGLNSEVCPELIFRTICHKVISRRTSHMILSQLFHILQDMLQVRCQVLIKSVDLTTYYWWYIPHVIFTLSTPGARGAGLLMGINSHRTGGQGVMTQIMGGGTGIGTTFPGPSHPPDPLPTLHLHH